jgi:hypothetical protein
VKRKKKLEEEAKVSRMPLIWMTTTMMMMMMRDNCLIKNSCSIVLVSNLKVEEIFRQRAILSRAILSEQADTFLEIVASNLSS